MITYDRLADRYVIDGAADAAALIYRVTKGLGAYPSEERRLQEEIASAVARGEVSATWTSGTSFAVGLSAGSPVGSARWVLRASLRGEDAIAEERRLRAEADAAVGSYRVEVGP